MGPNSMTYLIAGEVFPTNIRGLGAGFAATFAKIGACFTAFLFPLLLNVIGVNLLMLVIAVACIVGMMVTHAFKIDTTKNMVE